MRFCSRPTRWMLAASSGMDMRGVLRTLRPVGRDTSRDSGTRIRFLVGSAASSGIAAAVLMARASVWVTAFMVITPIGSGMQQRKRQGLLPACRVGIQAFNWRMPSASSQRARFSRMFWSMPCTGRVCCRRPLALRPRSPPGQVFLGAVEHAPQVGAAVVEAARHQDLRFRDGRGLVGVVVLEGERGAGEHFGFAIVKVMPRMASRDSFTRSKPLKTS